MGGGTQVNTVIGFNLPIGYAAQVTSFGTRYRNLEGPVFGMRVGIYHSDSGTQGWKSIGDEKSTKDYRMVVYKLPHGILETTERDDYFMYESDNTLAGSVKKKILKSIDKLPGFVNKSFAYPEIVGQEPKRRRLIGLPTPLPVVQEESILDSPDIIPADRLDLDPEADQWSDEELEPAEAADSEFWPTA